jgi:hypothetical protein
LNYKAVEHTNQIEDLEDKSTAKISTSKEEAGTIWSDTGELTGKVWEEGNLFKVVDWANGNEGGTMVDSNQFLMEWTTPKEMNPWTNWRSEWMGIIPRESAVANGSYEEARVSQAQVASLEEEEEYYDGDTPDYSDCWDEEWNSLDQYSLAPITKGGKINSAFSKDYVDNGLPHQDFLILYPETYGSNLGDNWEELPGYNVGHIRFMMLLNSVGTMQYLMNDYIWTKQWWIMPSERYGLYCGSRGGQKFAQD